METLLNKKDVTCIIPFYNENAKGLRHIIATMVQVEEIQKIIVIDDGSESKKTFNFLIDSLGFMNKVKFIRKEQNKGKCSAINFALRYAFSENIILIDADLKDLRREDVIRAIINFKYLQSDMVILRRVNSLPLVKFIRADTLLSGERIIKKSHLKKILQSGVTGYQLEVGINQYFINNNLQDNCFWSKSNALNNYKHKKSNFFKGVFKDLRMYFNLIRYVGIGNFKRQVSGFCKQEA